MLRGILLFIFLSISSLAHAGSWVSSGGELFKDAHNPWFVRNTRDVNYCVQVAPSISLSKEQVQEIVRQSITFWKAEFKRYYSNTPVQKGSFLLGSQEFREVDCTSAESIDLRILLGFETLSQLERDY